MLNALRLRGGFNPSLYTARTGLEIRQLEPVIARLVERGMLEYEPELLRPSSLGWRFLDDLVAAFL